MLQLSSTGGVQAGRGALQQGHAHGCVGAMAQRAGGRRRVQHQHHSAPPGPNACRGARHVCAAALGDDAVPASRRAFLAAALTGAVWAQAWDAGVAFAGGASITKVFVAGATGETGRRIVQQLRAQGYTVIAGARDLNKARSLGLGLDTQVTLAEADVTKGAASLAMAMGDAQAVICATGFSGWNVTQVGSVDEEGTKALVDAAKSLGMKKFILVSSLLTNAKAVGQENNANYKFLNLFGGVLDHKLAAERYLRASGLNYTIVRPGGLTNAPPEEVGNLIARPEDSLFGLDTDQGRSISRDTVASVTVAALTQPTADNKVVEIVASQQAPSLPADQWFP